MKRYAIHMCDNTSIPGETECLAAIYSMGRDCKKCHRDDCYRQGWTADRVTQDNARFVREKHAGRRMR